MAPARPGAAAHARALARVKLRALAAAASAALLASIALATGCQRTAPARVAAPADSAAGEVAFRLAGPGGAVLLVPVMVNGQGPFDFVLDTGATMTCVDEALSERLGLPGRAGRIGLGVGVTQPGRVRLIGIDSLQVGAARAYDLTGCAIGLQHIQAIGVKVEGLLGLNFLKQFQVTLDFERQVLRLEEAAS